MVTETPTDEAGLLEQEFDANRRAYRIWHG